MRTPVTRLFSRGRATTFITSRLATGLEVVHDKTVPVVPFLYLPTSGHFSVHSFHSVSGPNSDPAPTVKLGQRSSQLHSAKLPAIANHAGSRSSDAPVWSGKRGFAKEAAAAAKAGAPVAPKPFSAGDKINEKAQLVFDACWRKLESKWANVLQCPHEIVWLNGAPGAGKGANTPFIMKSRGLSRSVAMSDMLNRNPKIKHLMEAGELVPDTMVGDALLDIIFSPEENDGVGMLIDGFPRTALQVDFLKLLYDKMLELHNKHADGPEEWQYPRPSFKVVVLYVEMEESVKRQMLRATMAAQHNKRAADAGSEDIWNVRTTDVDASRCRRRYDIFREATLLTSTPPLVRELQGGNPFASIACFIGQSCFGVEPTDSHADALSSWPFIAAAVSSFKSDVFVQLAIAVGNPSVKLPKNVILVGAHYATILRLKQYFPFSLIDAMGSLEDTRAQISRELRYQSSLDLDESTYAAIRHLPLAQDLVRASRQQLVHRLDTYSKRHHKIFMEVVRIIDNDAVPLLKRCSLAGHATLKSPAKVFTDHPLAADMCIDILSDRGFSVAHTVNEVYVPSKIDMETGEVHNSMHELHFFRITFEREGVRQQTAAATSAPTGPSAGLGQIAIGQTYIPSHLDRESRRIRHHNPVTGFVTNRPQATIVDQAGDETHPDGTVRTHAEAAADVEVMLKNQVQDVSEAVQKEGMTPATPPDKARVQHAWDSHYEPAEKQAPTADYALPSAGKQTDKS